MKTKIIQLSMLLVFSTFCTTLSFAQFKVGPTVGFNYSTVSDRDVDRYKDNDKEGLFGLRAGLTFDWGIATFFSVVPEVLYSQMGWKMVGKGQREGITEIRRLNYIQVPLNLVFKFKMGTNAKLLLFTGAYGGYAISGNNKVIKEGTVIESEKVLFGSQQGEINPLDFGFNMGVGIQRKSLFVKTQFNISGYNMGNMPEDSILNGALALSFGYLF